MKSDYASCQIHCFAISWQFSLPSGFALKTELYVVVNQRFLLCCRMFGADCDSRMGGRFSDGMFFHTTYDYKEYNNKQAAG